MYAGIMNKYVFLLILISLFLPGVFAQKNTIKLLAVTDNTQKGTVVDLDLDIIDGSGKVLLETYPLSQIDTQISLRVAKTIACASTDVYCLNKEFIYSIKANSPIIAGPSAGAAITILTLASLENKKIDPNTVITGTINSGGVIGVVGGAEEKIKAAHDSGIKRVLVPKGEKNSTELFILARELNISLIEVSDLEDAFAIFSNQEKPNRDLFINKEYLEIMKKVNREMCSRTNKLQKEVQNKNITDEKATNITQKAKNLTESGLYYSGASRCFGANSFLQADIINSENLTKEGYNQKVREVEKQILEIENYLNSTQIDNLGSLETSMIIRERIFDAKTNLDDFRKSNATTDLSYAIERILSAELWKEFMSFSGKKIDASKLKESCVMKLNEVQEVYNYVEIYMPSLMEESKKELERAKEYLDTNDYALCLFKASKSKAEIDAALSTLYFDDELINILLENKILAAKKAIIKQTNKGNFPILGHSYFEYANALKESEKYTALLYAEYGIEMSNLDIYFPQNKPLEIKINWGAAFTLISGFIMGISIFAFRNAGRRKITLKRK